MKKRYLFMMFLLVGVGILALLLPGKKVIAPTKMEDGGMPAGLPTLATQNDFLNVVYPKTNDFIVSPLTVTGFARGNWYFEASFPIKILDANGKIIGQGIAKADGDWMTEKFVRFYGTVNFTPSETKTGFVVFQKDNPSGLPENDKELRVPVVLH